MSTLSIDLSDTSFRLYGRQTAPTDFGSGFLARRQDTNGTTREFRCTGTDLTVRAFGGSNLEVSVDGGSYTSLTGGGYSDVVVFSGLSDVEHAVSLRVTSGGNVYIREATAFTATGASPAFAPPQAADAVLTPDGTYLILGDTPFSSKGRVEGGAYTNTDAGYSSPSLFKTDYPDARIRVRGAVSEIYIWTFNRGETYTLDIDNVRQSSVVGPTSSKWGWLLVGTGLDPATEHVYGITLSSAASSQYADAILLVGGTGLSATAVAAPSKKFVAAGDSIIHGTTGTGSDSTLACTWIAGVAEAYDFANRGLIGDTAAGLLARIADLTAYAPDIAYVCIGRNDITGGTDTTAFGTSIASIISALQDSNAAMKIIMAAPYNILGSDSTRATYDAVISAKVAAAGSALVTYDDTSGVIGSAGDFFGSPHPNNAGYVKMAAHIEPLISSTSITTTETGLFRRVASQTVHVIGTGTSFTGTPITASVGTITAQTSVDSTHVTVTYTGPSSGSSVTFTDTGSGSTVAVPLSDMAATGYGISAPGTCTVGNAITVTVTATPSGAVFSGSTVITVARSPDGTIVGTITPSSGALTGTTTYTPTTIGTKTLTPTAAAPLGTDPTAITTVAGYPTATSYTLTRPNPGGGAIGTASGNFTIAIPSSTTLPSGVVVTPAITGGGTISPTTRTLGGDNASGTFTVTPSGSASDRTVSVTNDGGLTNPSSVTYVATAAGGTYTPASNVRARIDRGDGVLGTCEVPDKSFVKSDVAVDDGFGFLLVPFDADVRLGVDFGVSSDGISYASRGLLHVPATNHVLTGTAVDATTGTLTIPTAGQVLVATAYGIGGTGSTGTLTVPTAGNVRLGTTFGASLANTGTLAVPAANKVLSPTAVDNTTGTLTLATAAQTLLGVTYGIGGNGLTGTVRQAATTDVRSGTQYGPSDSLTGSYAGGGGGSFDLDSTLTGHNIAGTVGAALTRVLNGAGTVNITISEDSVQVTP